MTSESRSDLDAWWRRLGSATLVGTARRPPPSVAELAEHGVSVTPRAGARPEEAALDSAALGGALRRAGRVPSTGAVVVEAAPDEHLDEAPARAGQLLELLLTQPPTDTSGTDLLLRHWCATCRESGHRVAHRLLPALLARATSADLRAEVSGVTGERGAWLAAQNPDWRWLAGRAQHGSPTASSAAAPLPDPGRWAHLGTESRVSGLRGLRAADPAGARDLLLTTWSSDSAKDRRALLEVLRARLGTDDEDFLEAALDDRAGSVRELAAELLDGLPGSRRAARMADRLRALVQEEGRLRRRLAFTLPDDPDAAGRRDGLGKPPAGRSARGWWLERIVAGAPFDVWDGPAEKVVPRIDGQDVLAGLRRAAAARRDVAWARALLGRGITPELLAVLPADEREARVLDQLGSTAGTGIPALLANLPLAGSPSSWSPRASAAVVSRLTRLRPEETGQVLEAVVPRLVRGLHADAVPSLQRWRNQVQLPRRQDDQLGSLIQSRTLRHTISEAFQT